MKRRHLAASLLAGAVCLSCAAPGPAPADCPAPQASQEAALHGWWSAELAGLGPARMLLEQSREYRAGLSGRIERDGVEVLLAGDMDEGQFTLEESTDGTHISATWVGALVAASCGREIRGTWSDAQSGQERTFVLRKAPS